MDKSHIIVAFYGDKMVEKTSTADVFGMHKPLGDVPAVTFFFPRP
jgi:hypothetical protein